VSKSKNIIYYILKENCTHFIPRSIGLMCVFGAELTFRVDL